MRTRSGMTLLLSIILVLADSGQQASLAAPNAVEIVRSGAPAPGGNGQFRDFGNPTVNIVGSVVFNATLIETDDDRADDSGIYRASLPASGAGPTIIGLQEVFREGESYGIGGEDYSVGDINLTAVLLQDTPISFFGSPVAGQFSAMAVRLPVTAGNPDGNSVIAVEDGQGDWQLVAAAGEVVPGGEGTFGELTNGSLSGISNNLGVIFGASLNDTPEGSADNVGLYRYVADGSVQELVRKGTPTVAGTFAAVGGLRPNSFGGAVFSTLDDSGDPDNDTTIFRVGNSGTGLVRVVGEGDDVPFDNPQQREFAQVRDYRLNNNESVGFSGRLRDAATGFAIQDGSGLYLASSSGVVAEIVREGQLIPDGSARFRAFVSLFGGDEPRPAFNDLEQFAFAIRTDVENTGEQSSGLFLASENEVVQLALQGDAYEDGTFLAFRRDPALNNQGLVVFNVELNVGTGIDDEGEFVITNELLVLTNGQDFATIAREGEQIGSRTIREIIFNNNPVGPANGLNDNGAVVFSVDYEDGSGAVIYWRPELGWQAPTGDGDWDDPANWFFNIPPNLDSNVAIDTDTDSNIAGPGADTTVNAVSVGNGSGLVTLTFNGGNIATRDGTTIGQNGSLMAPTGAVATLTGPVSNNGNIELGSNSELTIAGGYSGSGNLGGLGSTVVFQGGIFPGSD